MTNVDMETGEIGTGMPPAIAKAIIAVKKQIKQLGVDERNLHGDYKYVSVDKFYAIVGPLMAEAGLALLIDETSSGIEVSESTDRQGNPRKTPWLFANYTLAFMHEEGDVSAPMRRSLAMPINGPQTYGAAQSYVEKQFLRQVFKIPTGEKDAEETAQGDDAPARGRQRQGTGSAATPVAGNGLGAPTSRQNGAETPDKQDADRRWRELARDIDACATIPELERIPGCPAWQACWTAIERHVGKDAADTAMDSLNNRIGRRRGLMLVEADRTADLPI